MVRADDRAHEEDDVRLPIHEVLAAGGSWTTQELTKAVRGKIGLFPADVSPAAKRDAEQKIDQIIANALQSKRKLCKDRLIERVAVGEFRIAPNGLGYLRELQGNVEDGVSWLEQHYPGLE